MAEVTGTWLDVDPRDGGEASAKKRAEILREAVEFAQLYVEVFERSVAGKKLLAHWIDTIESRDLSPNATHTEYAYHEARRAFVRGIQRQVQLGLTGSLK